MRRVFDIASSDLICERISCCRGMREAVSQFVKRRAAEFSLSLKPFSSCCRARSSARSCASASTLPEEPAAPSPGGSTDCCIPKAAAACVATCWKLPCSAVTA
eukprot:7384909-Prymnesium_polylepis.2